MCWFARRVLRRRDALVDESSVGCQLKLGSKSMSFMYRSLTFGEVLKSGFGGMDVGFLYMGSAARNPAAHMLKEMTREHSEGFKNVIGW